MRKIASNLLLKEHAERVFFLCKQPDGYRIIKEIDGDYIVVQLSRQKSKTFIMN